MNKTLLERMGCMLSEAKLPRQFRGEALYAAVHVINLSPIVPLDGDVPNRVCYGKDVSYDHLHQFGYTFYDPVEKKLVRSRDIVSAEEQFISDIKKAPASTSQIGGDLVDLSSLPLVPAPNPTEVQHDDIEDNIPEVCIPDDDDNVEKVDHQDHPKDQPPSAPVRRSERGHIPSTRYPSTEYICLTDEGEPECFEEAIKSDDRELWMEAMKDEISLLHENHTFDLVTLPKGKKAFRIRWVYKLK
ncbi:unnamed protein product [Amaranthus hypochondriacus]